MKAAVVLGTALFILPCNLRAQEPPPSPLPSSEFSIGVFGGVNANPNRWHGSGGLSVHGVWRGWGVLGMASLGAGGEYESSFSAVAATRRLFASQSISTMLFGGYGYYSESAPSGASRAAPGLAYGGLVRWHVGQLSMQFIISDLVGDHDGQNSGGVQVTEPFRFHVLRYSVGLGVRLHD